MRIICALYFLCFSYVLSAQTSGIIQEYDAGLVSEKCFCKPGVVNKSSGKGVSFGYTYSPGYDFTVASNDVATVSSVTKLKAKLKIPLVNIEGFKLLLGYEYNGEKYRFDNISDDYKNIFSSLDNKTLKINKFTLYMTKSFNEKYYTILRLRTAYAGTFDKLFNFEERYATYSAIGAFGIKKRDDLEIGFGLSFSNSFRRTAIFPFLVYNQTFNDKWGIESLLPAQIYGRYNINDKSLLIFGFNFNSSSYSIDVEEDAANAIYNFNHSEISASVAYERNIAPWVWISIKGGFRYSFSSDFEKVNDDFSLEAKPGATPFIRVSIFLSPPDKYIK